MNHSDPLMIAGHHFDSRLILGTARYPSDEVLKAAIQASGAEMVTGAIRRLGLGASTTQGLLERMQKGLFILPNTAGCHTAREAVMTAELAREALNTNWIKLEVVGDGKMLWPDVIELLIAADELVRKGFVVLPYCTDDVIICQRLIDIGCAAVMPLGAPIGSGLGIRNPYTLSILREQIAHPIIVDAGVGTASDVAIAMELGMDGVLVNSAIALAQHPVMMADAMRHACEAGRLAYRAGRIPCRRYAVASSPTEGLPCCEVI